MRIRITDLPAHGLTIQDTLPLDALNERMAEGRHNDIFFTSPPELNIHLRPLGRDVESRGDVSTSCRQPCSLCLEEREQEITAPFDFLLKTRTERNAEEEMEDGPGVVYFDGDVLDLEDLAQETLILSIRPFYRPETKGGSCVDCGRNIEEQLSTTVDGPKGTPLGSLLKKAGVRQ